MKTVLPWVLTACFVIAAVILIIPTFASAPASNTPDSDVPPETTLSAVLDDTSEPIQEIIHSEPTTEPATESTTEATTEPTTEPAAEATAEPTTEPTTDPTEDEGQDYVLNTNTRKFHYPSCSSADDIKEKNKSYFHGTRDELIAEGFSPCGRCHP